MFGEDFSKSIERDLDSIIYGPEGHQATQSLLKRKKKNEIRGIEKKGQLGKKDFQSLSINCLTE